MFDPCLSRGTKIKYTEERVIRHESGKYKPTELKQMLDKPTQLKKVKEEYEMEELDGADVVDDHD
eukprot:1141682-Pelagomonas_calceolata.AAC.7